jgi:hypothetical protein
VKTIFTFSRTAIVFLRPLIHYPELYFFVQNNCEMKRIRPTEGAPQRQSAAKRQKLMFASRRRGCVKTQERGDGRLAARVMLRRNLASIDAMTTGDSYYLASLASGGSDD